MDFSARTLTYTVCKVLGFELVGYQRRTQCSTTRILLVLAGWWKDGRDAGIADEAVDKIRCRDLIFSQLEQKYAIQIPIRPGFWQAAKDSPAAHRLDSRVS